jgi:glycosyltransferase involved in cell wall biosynthesis
MPRVALIENFTPDFLNFRVQLACFLESYGYEVIAVVPDDGYKSQLDQSGLKYFTYPLIKNSINPFEFLKSVARIRNIIIQNDIDIVHAFRLQPNILAGFASLFTRRRKIINHITGLGFAFTNYSISSLFYRAAILILYQVLLPFSSKIIVQNNSDYSIIGKLIFVRHKLLVIAGSGIDEKKYSRTMASIEIVDKLKKLVCYMPGEMIVTFTGRLLRDKGIMELFEAARQLIPKYPELKFIIAGTTDLKNPTALTETEIQNYCDGNKIKYIGPIVEIRELLYITSVFVLPTYREGFPRSILEAMSMEVPVITTKVPGSMDLVTDTFSGILIPPRNVQSLCGAIEFVINNRELAVEYARNGRLAVQEKFRNEIVFRKILKVYDTL